MYVAYVTVMSFMVAPDVQKSMLQVQNDENL